MSFVNLKSSDEVSASRLGKAGLEGFSLGPSALAIFLSSASGTLVASIRGSPFASADHALIRADLARATAGSADTITKSKVSGGRDGESNVEEGGDKEDNYESHSLSL